jgi:hypothetical protein
MTAEAPAKGAVLQLRGPKRVQLHAVGALQLAQWGAAGGAQLSRKCVQLDTKRGAQLREAGAQLGQREKGRGVRETSSGGR